MNLLGRPGLARQVSDITGGIGAAVHGPKRPRQPTVKQPSDSAVRNGHVFTLTDIEVLRFERFCTHDEVPAHAALPLPPVTRGTVARRRGEFGMYDPTALTSNST